MIIRWTYYLIPRLILGTLFSVFTIYGAVYIWNERLIAGVESVPALLTSAVGILSFVFAWRVWHLAGKSQLSSLIRRAKSAIEEKEYDSGRKYYDSALALADSSHYMPDTGDATRQKFYSKYADFLCGAGVNDEEAIGIYETYFRIYPDDAEFAGRIIPLAKSSDYITTRHLSFLNRLHILRPEYDDFRDYTAEQYLSSEVYNSDSQELLLDVIRKNSPLKGKALSFLLPRMLEQDRADIKALEIYLESLYLKIEHRFLKPMLGKIAEKARFEENPGPLSRMILDAFDEMPPAEREEIRAAVRLERMRKVPVKEEPAKTDTTPEEEYEDLTKFNTSGEIFSKTGRILLNAVAFIFKSGMSLAIIAARSKSVLKWAGGVILIGVMVFGIGGGIFSIGGKEDVSLEVISDKPFTIQTAAFKQRERAERAIREILAHDIRAHLVVTEGTTAWYQVRIDHFDTIPEARAKADSLKNAGVIANYFIANFEPGEYLE